MSIPEVVLLSVAGVGAGLIGSVAGLASLISYPALLGIGLPPVTANVTNTVALVFSGVGSALGSRVELTGQATRLRRLGVAALLGGALGAGLLLHTPPGAFALAVPWLIGVASVLILVQPQRLVRRLRTAEAGAVPTAATFLVAIYVGYFGAAAGVLLLAVLLAVTSETLARSNALKNVTMCLANAVAAVAFGFFGSVRWAAVLPLALGFLLGGWLGPLVVRHAPARAMRVAIGLAGLGLAGYLGVKAYR
ncbi:UPF0721 transmembrane protein [Gandjariella thermophila]|uniref:Probable membrane transporter protein n=1 Tax=Gandjariella thermophila TaxID=1931992 RepID=A0A4D4JB88_9PSEU|nr:UPF0721 transmembrane protein [Gandjariella thermophila]